MANNFQLQEDVYQSPIAPLYLTRSAELIMQEIGRFQLLEDISESLRDYESYVTFDIIK